MSVVTPTLQQQEAIQYPGSMVVIARPGSGKTYILSQKIGSVLPKLPDHKGIIAISYTNKASDELKNRSQQNGLETKGSFFGTIDRFCSTEIIIPFLAHIWGPSTESIQIIRSRDLPEEDKKDLPNMPTAGLDLQSLEDITEFLKTQYKKGVLFLEANGALALYVINNSVACRRYIKSRYTHIIIDEYQDSGQEQHELFLLLQNLGLIGIAVGDADQSIFRFSGKDSKYLLDLSKDSNFKLFPVDLNHRCHPSIINYSLRLLSTNSSIAQTNEIRVFEKICDGNQHAVASWIDQSIPEMMRRFGVEKRMSIGILTRNNLSGSMVDETLSIQHRFFRTTPLEEAFNLWANLFCALLRFKLDSTITAEEIIESKFSQLNNTQTREIREKIKSIRLIEDKEILFNVLEEIATILLPNARSESSLTLLAETLTDEQAYRAFQPASPDEIQIMTLHKSKGLEFDIVFHMDLYQWILPSASPGPGRDFENPDYNDWAQDINLHYVGITRARKACYLCHSTSRINSEFQTRRGAPSEFLEHNKVHEMRIKV